MNDSHLPTLVSSLEKSQARRLHAAAAALSVYHYERLAHTDAANLPSVNRPAIKSRCTLLKTLWNWLRLVF
jgi:hypothetical protein